MNGLLEMEKKMKKIGIMIFMLALLSNFYTQVVDNNIYFFPQRTSEKMPIDLVPDTKSFSRSIQVVMNPNCWVIQKQNGKYSYSDGTEMLLPPNDTIPSKIVIDTGKPYINKITINYLSLFQKSPTNDIDTFFNSVFPIAKCF